MLGTLNCKSNALVVFDLFMDLSSVNLVGFNLHVLCFSRFMAGRRRYLVNFSTMVQVSFFLMLLMLQ